MNGIDHYKRAEELLVTANEPDVIHSVTGQPLTYKHGADAQARMTATAHVHALLALSAAQADATAFKRELYRANGEELPGAKRTESKTARDAAAAAAFLD